MVGVKSIVTALSDLWTRVTLDHEHLPIPPDMDGSPDVSVHHVDASHEPEPNDAYWVEARRLMQGPRRG